MDQQELKASISAIIAGIERATLVDAQSPTDKIFGALLLTGIGVVGELLLDVKRIADAAGPPVHMHFHCPDGSVLNAVGNAVRIEPWFPPAMMPPFDGERLARFLARKEAARKDVEHDAAEPAEVRDARHQRWVDGNWGAFQDEAADLLAAALPGSGGK